MAKYWYSDNKPWDYIWTIPKDTPLVLHRCHETLGFSFSETGPANLFAFIEILDNKEKYKKIFRADTKLKVEEVRYWTLSDGDKACSFIKMNLLPNVLNACGAVGLDTEVLLRSRKAEGMPELIDYFIEAEKKFKAKKIDSETCKNLEHHLNFCKALAFNKSGLQV